MLIFAKKYKAQLVFNQRRKTGKVQILLRKCLYLYFKKNWLILKSYYGTVQKQKI